MKVKVEKILPNLNSEIFYNGKKYEVSYLLPDDEVEFELVGKKRKKVIIKNKIIQTPREHVHCSYYSLCGGCSGQHIDYKHQFFLKTNHLILDFKRAFGVDLKLKAAEKIYHYRNRMDFVTFPEKIGLRQRGNFRKIVDIQTCKIQSEWSNIELDLLRDYFKQNHFFIYNRKTQEGFLKYITLRKAFYTDDNLTILTFNEEFLNTSGEKELIDEILKISTAKNIVFCYNRKRGEISATGTYKVIKGKSSYKECILGKNLEIPFDCFTQPNLIEFKHILNFIDFYIKREKLVTLVDLFSGIGFFSLIFGESFKSLYGFDICKSSIQKANLLLKSHFPSKDISFLALDLFSKNGKNFLKNTTFDKNTTLIVDPPRSGIHDYVIEHILDSSIETIFYVSCNPITQIQDLKKLNSCYDIKDALLVDPYPQTPHLESVCYLKRKT